MKSKADPTVFTLTMLGTDTVFTPTLKEKKKKNTGAYPKGETLSIIATHIQTAEAPKIDTKDTAPFKAAEVEVINGPTTLGTEVGDRIARGVAASLRAIARGQYTINITAHSRGAVESIIIAHELDSVQELITKCSNVDELIKALEKAQKERNADTKTANTTGDIIKVLREELKSVKGDTKWFTDLKQHFPTARVNIFGIDPVPGDVRPITWRDPRFHVLPKIVKDAQVIYYANELSDWGFTPILVEKSENAPSDQTLTIDYAPGHHGAGSSGSNLSQQGIDVNPIDPKHPKNDKAPPKKLKSTAVQKLMIYKIMDFLQQHGVAFKETLDLFAEGRGLGGSLIQERERHKGKNRPKLLTEKGFDFPAIYRTLYSKIYKNQAAYDAFNKTHYSFMGLLTDGRKMLKRGEYIRFRDVFKQNHGYVNEDHVSLMQQMFFNLLGLNNFENKELDEIVRAVTQLLKSKIENTPTSITASINGVVIDLTKKNVRDDLLNTFAALISRVSQKYLTSDWSSPEKTEQKKRLFAQVYEMIETFRGLPDGDNPDIKEFISNLLQQVLNGLQNTVKQQAELFYSEFNRLNMSQDEQLEVFMHQFLLQIQNPIAENVALIRNITTTEAYRKLDSMPDKIQLMWAELQNKLDPVIMKRYFKQQLKNLLAEQIRESDKTHTYEELKTLFEEQFNESFENYQLKRLQETFHEQYGDEHKDYEQLYQKTQIFMDDLEALANIGDSAALTFESIELKINKLRKALVNQAAQRAYKKDAKIDPQVFVREDFDGLVAKQAVVHYKLTNPVATLVTDYNQLSDEKAQLVVTQAELTDEKADLEQRYQADMRDEFERDNLILINKRLRPLTKNYLKHLKDEEAKIKTQLVKSPANGDYLIALDKVEKKIGYVETLLEHLSKKPANVLIKPSEQVKNFFELLNTAEEELKLHRDPAWRRYVITTVTVASILITGILPGLIALAIYASVGGPGRSSMFWRSYSENVVGELQTSKSFIDPQEYDDGLGDESDLDSENGSYDFLESTSADDLDGFDDPLSEEKDDDSTPAL